jgi:hypothetical protein
VASAVPRERSALNDWLRFYVDDQSADRLREIAPGGKPRTSIPRHNELGYGLARDICKQLGVPPPTGSR